MDEFNNLGKEKKNKTLDCLRKRLDLQISSTFMA